MNEISVELAAGQLWVHRPQGSFALTAHALRAACRCSGCRAAERAGTPVAPPRDVEIVRANEVGAYAVQLCFSDGHERGIYPGPYLIEIVSKSATA